MKSPKRKRKRATGPDHLRASTHNLNRALLFVFIDASEDSRNRFAALVRCLRALNQAREAHDQPLICMARQLCTKPRTPTRLNDVTWRYQPATARALGSQISIGSCDERCGAGTSLDSQLRKKLNIAYIDRVKSPRLRHRAKFTAALRHTILADSSSPPKIKTLIGR